MRKLRPESAVLLVIVGILAAYPTAAQTESSSNKSNLWDLCTVCGVPARMALNKSPGPQIVPRRDIYLLIEEQDFTVENLKKAFENLSAAYPVPVWLNITAYSNKVYLQQLIIADGLDVFVDFVDTPEGRKAEENYYAHLYPPRTGYLRASYLRIGVEESFQYTPDPRKDKTVQIVLKNGPKK